MGFASHQCKFHFDSMYGGLDAPYGSNNMKIDKEGSLDVQIISRVARAFLCVIRMRKLHAECQIPTAVHY